MAEPPDAKALSGSDAAVHGTADRSFPLNSDASLPSAADPGHLAGIRRDHAGGLCALVGRGTGLP